MIPTMSVSAFTRHEGEFVAEASDLLNCGRQIPQEIRVHNPATGRTLSFFLTVTQRDGEGDVQLWRYLPSLADLNKYPGLKGITVFND